MAQADELLRFVETDVDSGRPGTVSEKYPIWARHAPQFTPPGSPPGGAGYRASNAGKEVSLISHEGVKAGRELWSEDAFMVPQVSPASTLSKRPRHGRWYH